MTAMGVIRPWSAVGAIAAIALGRVQSAVGAGDQFRARLIVAFMQGHTHAGGDLARRVFQRERAAHRRHDLGRETRSRYADLIPIFRADKYPKLSAAEKESCTGKIQDLMALMRREHTPLTAATSLDDYEWALRQAIGAAQDDAFLRSLPAEFDLGVPRWWEAFPPGKVWDHNAEMREVAMADNVLWVQQRECRRGRVFYFAHNEHIQAGPGILGSPGHPPAGQYRQIRGAGSYLRSALGPDLVLIGTYFGHGEGFGVAAAPPQGVHEVEDLLGSLLRRLGRDGVLARLDDRWRRLDHEAGRRRT